MIESPYFVSLPHLQYDTTHYIS